MDKMDLSFSSRQLKAIRRYIDLVREQQWALINGDYSGTFTSDYFLAG